MWPSSDSRLESVTSPQMGAASRAQNSPSPSKPIWLKPSKHIDLSTSIWVQGNQNVSIKSTSYYQYQMFKYQIEQPWQWKCQLWLGLLGIIPGIAFPALSFTLWGIFQTFFTFSSTRGTLCQPWPRSLGVTHAAMSAMQGIQHNPHNLGGFQADFSTWLPTRGNVQQELF